MTTPPPTYRLLSLAVGGMAILGMSAMVAQWLKEGWLRKWWLPQAPVQTLALSAFVGAFVGLLSIPIVVPCLQRKSLRAAFPFVFGPSLLLVTVYVYAKDSGRFGPLSAAIPAFVAVCFLSGLAWRALPNVRPNPRNLCPSCGYDLRANPDARCPECGCQRNTAPSDNAA